MLKQCRHQCWQFQKHSRKHILSEGQLYQTKMKHSQKLIKLNALPISQKTYALLVTNFKSIKKKHHFIKSINIYKIPQIAEIIAIYQKLHIKLLSSSPFPLPEWFLKGSDCRLKTNVRKLPSYVRNFKENKNIPINILNELHQMHSKKPIDKAQCLINLLCYALLLRYLSRQF